MRIGDEQDARRAAQNKTARYFRLASCVVFLAVVECSLSLNTWSFGMRDYG